MCSNVFPQQNVEAGGGSRIAMSSPPAFGAFAVNAAPPDSYTAYQEYVHALAAAAVKAFTIENVRRWRWTVCTQNSNLQN